MRLDPAAVVDTGKDEVRPSRSWLSGTAIWLATAVAVLDGAIANIALPTIARQFGASPAASIWVINAYHIAITMTLLTFAALGEILEYRKVYVGGLLLFVVASAGCTIAESLETLTAWRFIQGLGASAIMAVNGALVRFTYPSEKLARGLAANALVVGIASAAGPSLAVAILAWGSWRWLFAVNLPIGLCALALGSLGLPRVTPIRRPFSAVAALLCAIAFAALFLSASDIATGHTAVRGFLGLALSAGGFLLLIRHERGVEAPLVPVDLLRNPLLRLSYMTSSGSFMAQMLALVSLPFYLQGRLGFGHFETGAVMTAWPLSNVVAAPVAARLVERIPASRLGSIGLVVTALGLFGAAIFASPWLIGIALASCGAGFGIFQTPNNRIMMGRAPRARSGAAAGMLATARLVGQTAGATVLALLFQITSPTSVVPLLVASSCAVAAAFISSRRSEP